MAFTKRDTHSLDSGMSTLWCVCPYELDDSLQTDRGDRRKGWGWCDFAFDWGSASRGEELSEVHAKSCFNASKVGITDVRMTVGRGAYS